MLDSFYDDLSPFYHIIFEDWDHSIQKQAKILDRIIIEEWGNESNSVLDVSCGIGTQAIGLAQIGYTVTASDLSSKEIERAKREAKMRNLEIDFSVCDMKKSFVKHQKQFDVLISCDNSIPHLLSDGEILTALKEFHKCLKNGGGCIITIRDYEKEERKDVKLKPYGVRLIDGKKFIVFQTWEFHGELYNLSMYFVSDDGLSEPETKVFRTRYYAIGVPKLIGLMKEAGFIKVNHIVSDYYQPVIIGTKP